MNVEIFYCIDSKYGGPIQVNSPKKDLLKVVNAFFKRSDLQKEFKMPVAKGDLRLFNMRTKKWIDTNKLSKANIIAADVVFVTDETLTKVAKDSSYDNSAESIATIAGMMLQQLRRKANDNSSSDGISNILKGF